MSSTPAERGRNPASLHEIPNIPHGEDQLSIDAWMQSGMAGVLVDLRSPPIQIVGDKEYQEPRHIVAVHPVYTDANGWLHVLYGPQFSQEASFCTQLPQQVDEEHIITFNQPFAVLWNVEERYRPEDSAYFLVSDMDRMVQKYLFSHNGQVAPCKLFVSQEQIAYMLDDPILGKRVQEEFAIGLRAASQKP